MMTGFLQTPARVLLSDVLIAEGTHGLMPQIRAKVLRNFTGTSPSESSELSKDTLDEPDVVQLGQGASVLETTDVPRYPELFSHVCREMNWDPSVFHVFRCRVEYPIMPSMLWLEYDLPKKPAESN